MPSPKAIRFYPSRLKNLLLSLSVFLILYLLFLHNPTPCAPLTRVTTTRQHILFSIASSSSSFPRRKPYILLWYKPATTRAVAFLDRPLSPPLSASLPPVIISKDTSAFPYTFKGGLKSAIRVARVVKETVELNLSDVRWFVFGDDDTVFFVENLVEILSNYDHEKWYYIGSNSESYEQNMEHSVQMAFGGAGFAVSSSLGKALARVLDSCLLRYGHLYGSDARVFSCLAELGVGLTHQPGFHQVDMRGNLFGMLSAHPLSPLLSLHHVDAADPLFPNMTKIQAMKHLFKAADADPARILQQTVCYDRINSLTVSVAWGYSVQVFEGNELLPDLLSVQKSFKPWRKSASVDSSHYMFNTREYARDPCKRAMVFFMDSVTRDKYGIWSNYSRHVYANCSLPDAMKSLEYVGVLSQKLEPDPEQAPRRHCCDISSSNRRSMVISIRHCGADELISMHS